jgi:hypothetical protein
MINLTALAFWKRKDSETPESERIIPLPTLPKPVADQTRSASEDDVNKARGALKVLQLERQIIGSALTTIFESESKGVINQNERERLVNKYKVDLQELDRTIEENQRVVDLHDLEKSREELIRDFNARLSEMEAKIRNLKSGNVGPLQIPPAGSTANLGTEKVEHQATDAEKRVEQIRDEILKAMDRLEQIESEG